MLTIILSVELIVVVGITASTTASKGATAVTQPIAAMLVVIIDPIGVPVEFANWN